jgi:hypothetical protein
MKPMATSVQTARRKRRYTEDNLKRLPRDGYKLRELFLRGNYLTSTLTGIAFPAPPR